MSENTTPSGSDAPDERPTAPIGDGRPVPDPVDEPNPYAQTAPPQTAPPQSAPAPTSRRARLAQAARSRPWVPLAGVGVGAAVIAAAITSALFLANPVDEDRAGNDRVDNAAMSRQMDGRGGPGIGEGADPDDQRGGRADRDGDRAGMCGPGGMRDRTGPGGRPNQAPPQPGQGQQAPQQGQGQTPQGTAPQAPTRTG
ncbi:hypothetical protein [Williamsia sp. CHRR-6]|uniref:hypothetical protein n=1 Tax=Williamsia sp. CHRR-6 TaxID=2835871 RepID=UPI001BD9543D|nr:hypothetical protein [Williamsia sp. CHRR-6]MBT0567281.1 hypothetical protein [Williamsia sp. CHRR-6]